MEWPWLVVAAASAVCAVLFALERRARRSAVAARQQLEAASMELQRLQLSFSRFAPSQVVDRIAAAGIPANAEKKQVTVLFADLVGFTGIAEHLEPDVLVQMVNGYFARMSHVVTEHSGHVSKFIGDGMLVLFGALDTNPWQANDAVHAALAMRAEIENYNRELEAAQLPRLRMGIGIHQGVVVAGLVGSHELMEFTVIGSAVNLASRVERLTRVHGVDILVTQAVQQSLDPRFELRALPATAVRGFEEHVPTFTVLGFAPDRTAS